MVIIVIALLVPLLVCSYFDNELLVDSIAAAHSNHFGRMKSFSCKLIVNRQYLEASSKKEPQTDTLYYWQRGEAKRIRFTSSFGNEDIFIQSSKKYILQSDEKSPNRPSGIITRSNDHLHGFLDPFISGLIKTSHPYGKTIPELIKEVKLDNCSPSNVDGVRTWKLTLSIDGNHSIWIDVDPAKNYAVVQSESKVNIATAKASPFIVRIVSKVGSFVELSDGFFFPEKVQTIRWTNGVKQLLEDCNFTDIRMNSILSDNLFKMPAPHGTIVNDLVRNFQYKVNRDWTPISVAISVTPAPDLHESASANKLLQPTVEKESTFWNMIVIFALCFVSILATWYGTKFFWTRHTKRS
jgi:outer membrane lipoprotein-sorting protein